MAALDPSNTARLKLNYTGDSGDHSTTIRVPDGLSTGALMSIATVAAGAFANVQWDSALWGAVEYIEKGVNFSNLIGVLNIQGGVFGSPNPPAYPAFITFGGRSSDSRLVDWEIYETAIYADANYRVLRSEDARVNSAYNGLASLAGSVVTIGGLPPVYRSYANLGYNAHYQRALRNNA